MQEFIAVLTMVNTVTIIAATIPLAIERWRSIVWRRMRDDAIQNDQEVAVPSDDDDISPSLAEGTTTVKKDMRRYSLDGEGRYGKGRLVLAVIRKYVTRHKGITYDALTSTFPKQLRGVKNEKSYWGCINLKKDAIALYRDTGIRRHFLDPQETLTLDDGTEVAVSSQWGIGNIGYFIDKARELGFRIVTVN